MNWLNSFSTTGNSNATRVLRYRPQVLAVGVALIVGCLLFASVGSHKKMGIELSLQCSFPAVYNFGDSNSDTGTVSAAFGRVPYPNGITFFGKPSGRYCDGRLIIDFIAEKLGLPYLSAYLDSLESNFQHGADFAASGTTIQPVDGKLYESGLNPLSLNVQLLQFEELKERTAELLKQDDKLIVSNRLPRIEDFSKALYTFDIGQNDLHNALTTSTHAQALKLVPKLINQLTSAIKKLYQQGARTFWIHNTGPIGCLPNLLLKYPSKPENIDEIGCVQSYNEVAQEFNSQLRSKISELRIQLQDSVIVYVDIYSAKYSLISNVEKQGFVDPLGYCCKHAGNSRLHCWNKDTVNGTTVYAVPCLNPSQYISWDSIHYTEAANQWVANQIFDSSFSDPSVSITSLCTTPISP